MTYTIREQLKEIKGQLDQKIKEWQDFKKSVDQTIYNANRLMVQTQDTMKQLQSMLQTTENTIKTLTDDYNDFKKKVENNWWMKLFGLGKG
jgi:predicted nuclease with TOPRIM domain